MAAQKAAVARRTTARAGTAVAVVEEVEFVNGQLETYWDGQVEDGLAAIDQAITTFGEALGQAIRVRLAAHVNAAIDDVAAQISGIAPPALEAK